MKQYVKVIEAEQFNGDIESLAEFVGVDNKVIIEDDTVILITEKDRWRVAITDYVAKGYYGLLVFKADRFLKEFQEILVDEADILEHTLAPVVKNEEMKSVPESHGTPAVATENKPVKKTAEKKE